MAGNADAYLDNADWMKQGQSWELPKYKSDEFYEYLERNDMTLEEFKELPVYKNAVENGLIEE